MIVDRKITSDAETPRRIISKKVDLCLSRVRLHYHNLRKVGDEISFRFISGHIARIMKTRRIVIY